MTLLEKTYEQLRNAGLAPNAQAFSVNYLGKNQNWYAYQKFTQRDFSIDAAVQCLRRLRNHQAATGLDQAQRKALLTAERALLSHLNARHCVADVLK